MTNPVMKFIKLSRPLFLIGGAGATFLGAGVARYLGRTINWDTFFLGLLWVLLVQLAAHYLNEYFDEPVDRHIENRTAFSGGSGMLGSGPEKLSRRVALSAFVVSLTLSMAVILTMIWTGAVGTTAGLLMALILTGALAYSLPPVQLSRTGYGEFVAAIIGGYLVPMLGFNLQTGEAHRLVALASLPLTLLLVVFFLVVSFPDYATDLKYGKRNFLVRAGWENVIVVLNTLNVLAYATLVVLWFFDFPRAILLPVFLAFPLGVFLWWQLRMIVAGGKPNWRALTLNAAAQVGVVLYLFTYTFWTR